MPSGPGRSVEPTPDDDVSWRSLYEAPNRHAGGLAPRLWDVSYVTGIWRGFPSDDQAPRYRAVAAAIDQGLTVPGAILDIGCGNGVLAHYLSPQAVARYVGVDVSWVAIAEAQRACARLGVEFLVADLRSWVPPTAPAVVVFNEILYYLRRPVPVVCRYAAGLHPGGEILVSMSHERWLHNPIARAHIDGIWRGLSRSFRALDAAAVLDGHGQKHCRVVRFATDPPPTNDQS